MKTLTLRAAPLAAALALAACSGGTNDDGPADNGMAPIELPDQNTMAPIEEPSPAPEINTMESSATNAVAPVAQEEMVAPDQQILDDAEATGMTARVNRDAPPEEAPKEE